MKGPGLTRVRAVLVAGAAALGSPAIAAESKPVVPAHVDIATIPMPVVQGGRLVNYVFLTLRLRLKSGEDEVEVREREPYLRDLLVRAAHRTPFARPGDFTRLDEPRLIRFMAVEAPRLLGPNVVTGVEVLNATPQRRGGFSAPAAHHAIIP